MPIAPLAGDLEMYYDDDNFTDPWRDPETVETIVLHHGNAKSGRLWYAWPPLLARQYRVIRVDMRGFGRSTVPEPGYDWSLEGFAGDLRNLLDHLELDKVHLIGETIGGNHRAAVRLRVSGAAAHGDHVHLAVQLHRRRHLPELLPAGGGRGRGRLGAGHRRPPGQRGRRA